MRKMDFRSLPIIIFFICLLIPLYSIAEEGLVAHWNFEEGSGFQTTDVVGGLSTSILRADFVSDPAPNGGSYALYCQGISSDYANESIAFELNVDSFSVSAWVKSLNDNLPYDYVFNLGDTSGAGLRYWLKTRNDGTFGISFDFSPFRLSISNTGSISLADNQYHHLIGVHDAQSKELRLYVDGKLSGSTSTAGMSVPKPLSPKFSICDLSFYGIVDEIKIYNRVLTDEEITDGSGGNENYQPQVMPLPDTGQTLCYDGSSMVTCTEENTGANSAYPGQDGRYGRDAAATAGQLTKVGGGDAGFDYTKVCNSGELAGEGSCPADPVLGSGTNDWGCTKDNITGLMWEVKTDDGGLRDKGWSYSWYSDSTRSDGTAGALNGGDAGTENAGDCYNKFDGDSGNFCDTAGYVDAVNTVSLCGASDWRMPKIEELKTLVHYGRYFPAIDMQYFPNTPKDVGAERFWSASSNVFFDSAWTLFFYEGRFVERVSKKAADSVRLVREGRLSDSLHECTSANPNTLLHASTPSTEFTVSYDQKTALHKSTGLIWDRCPYGTSLNDNGTSGVYSDDSCVGNLITYNWQSALSEMISVNNSGYLGEMDWHLPNIKELTSIVEKCGYRPSINSEIFPDTPYGYGFWSSSTNTSTPTEAWSVNSYYGYDVGYDKTSKFLLRFVRGGQSVDSFDLLNPPSDSDEDKLPDASDNCPNTPNPDQLDTDKDGKGDVCDEDDDNDGMPDSYEETNNFDPLDAIDADQDADGDGYTNLEEYKNNTDPREKDSFPKRSAAWKAILPLLLEGNRSEQLPNRLITTNWEQTGPYIFSYDTTKEACDTSPVDKQVAIENGEPLNDFINYYVGCTSIAVGQLINYYFQNNYRFGWLERFLENVKVYPRFGEVGNYKYDSCTHTGYSTLNEYKDIYESNIDDALELKQFLWDVALGLDSHFAGETSSTPGETFLSYALSDLTFFWTHDESDWNKRFVLLLQDRFRFNSNISYSVLSHSLESVKSKVISSLKNGQPIITIIQSTKSGKGHAVLIDNYRITSTGDFQVQINWGWGNSIGENDEWFPVNPDEQYFKIPGATTEWDTFTLFWDTTPINYP